MATKIAAPRATILPSEFAAEALPPILLGSATPVTEKCVRDFYLSIAEMLEFWIARHKSPHTQRSYRQGIMDFVGFLGVRWPEEGTFLYTVSVADVQAYRDQLAERGLASATRNHRISALAGFYRYLRELAAELRLPINIPNPAHSQFIARESADPLWETRALSLAQARRLRTLPATESLFDYRDRAILDLYLYVGCRIATGCRIQVSDFLDSEYDPKLRLNEKGDQRRTVGIHYNVAASLREYLRMAELRSGPLFRVQQNSRTQQLGSRGLAPTTMYYLLQRYLKQLPGALQEIEQPDGEKKTLCIYSPHSLRATTATLLLEAGEDICKVQELMGHKHVTTTQIYDKRRRASRESASHSVPI